MLFRLGRTKLASSSAAVFVHGFFSVELYTMSRSTDRSATGDCPSLPWRALSATTIFGVAALCRSFLYMCSRPEINGLESFLELLESRQDVSRRTRGLLTGIDPLYSTEFPCFCLIAWRTSIADMGLIRQYRTILACTYVRCALKFEATLICDLNEAYHRR